MIKKQTKLLFAYVPDQLRNDELYNVNFVHINAYAKQPNDMEKIKENEKAYMDKVTLTFKDILKR